MIIILCKIFYLTRYQIIIISLFQTRPTEPEVIIEDNIVLIQEQDTEMDSFHNISPIPGTSRDDAIPASSTSKSLSNLFRNVNNKPSISHTYNPT